MNDPYDLQRFVNAQQPVFETVLGELRAGRKRSHWMWFVFPQIKGLGHSAMARNYAISNLDEAKAYLAHPLLGPRLHRCSDLVAVIDGQHQVTDIFGHRDDVKFFSCMTLFERAAGEPGIFRICLAKFFAGQRDAATLAQLGD